MADDADRADGPIQAVIDRARAQAAAAPCLRANGKCHYCGECVTGKLLFCSTDCAQDFDFEKKQLHRSGKCA